MKKPHEHEDNDDEVNDDTENELESIPSEYADDLELEDVEGSLSEKLKQLRSELKESQKEKQQYLDGWQREKADLLNIKRRAGEEVERERERALESHIERLLPLCDSFEMAMNNTEAWEKADPVWRKGIEQIHTQLQSILTSYGVEGVGTVGEAFDPYQHEAVSSEQVTDEKQHNTVTAIYQKGYRVGERLVRPAKVIVGEYTKE